MRQIFPDQVDPCPAAGPWVLPGRPGTAQQTSRGWALAPATTTVIKKQEIKIKKRGGVCELIGGLKPPPGPGFGVSFLPFQLRLGE